MYILKKSLVFVCSFIVIQISSIDTQAQLDPFFNGQVVNEQDETLISANVKWQNTDIGTSTDTEGWFKLERIDTINNYYLEITYVGYETQIVEILPSENFLKLIVSENATIDDVVVESRERSNFSSTLTTLNVENISADELRRAACCNLSESFENNATVNVSFSDAITGAKEIEMLGLKGTYTRMLVENRPSFNRLGRVYGLEYIPGTFIQSIQISKGASSVMRGAQGITGIINTELIKPHKAPLLFINLFGNYVGRLELNTQFNYRLSQEWSTGLLLHGNYYNNEIDYNKDSFLDIPQKKQLNGISRWMYNSDVLHFELNVQGIWDDRNGGQSQKLFTALFDSSSTQLYQVNNQIRRIGAFGKLGYFGFNEPSQSIAVIFDANLHEHNAVFGNRNYDGLQKRIYANMIFQSKLIHKDHFLSTGIVYDLIDFEESFYDINNDRTEHNAGIYAEYDFSKTLNEEIENSFTLILGIRGDLFHTNTYTKIYPCPRVNFKYNFNPETVIRVSAGRGIRIPNTLIENFRYMPSSRSFNITENILPEDAWNYGLNFVWNFRISPKLEGNLSLDFYRTDFNNQLVADLDSDVQNSNILFYNLNGRSFANSFLISYTQDIVKGLEMRLAYKFNDVRMTFGNELNQVPFMPNHRALVHLNYTTANKEWAFNVTCNLIGPQRLPDIDDKGNTNLPDYRYDNYSPTFVTLNAHISKMFNGGWEIYLGGENLTNYTQEGPILGYQDPFASSGNQPDFDAASIYAPVFGAQVYAGIKYTFKGKERYPAINCSADDQMGNNQLDDQENLNNQYDLDQHESKISLIQSPLQCGMCVTTINKALNGIDGIIRVIANISDQSIRVEYLEEHITLDKIKELISNAGYDADELKANSKAYNKLPMCCKKPEDR